MKKRIFAVFCAVSLLLSSLPAVAADGEDAVSPSGEQTAGQTTTVAKGTQLTEGQTYNSAGGKNEERILVHTPGQGSAAMVAYGNSLRGLSTASYVADWLVTNGYEPVAGTNGDFYMTDTGIPIGIVVTDGVLRTSDRGQYAIGFLADGSAVIGKPSLTMVAGTDGGQSVKIDYINKTIQNYGVYLMNSDYSSNSRTTAETTYIRLQNPSQQLTASCTVTATVAEVVTTSQPMDFLAGELYLAATVENGNSARLDGVAVGQTVTISVSCPDPIWAQARYAVGAKELLVDSGEVQEGLDSARHPRTAAGVREDGSLVLYTVDGRQTGWSVGMGLDELARRMAELGCVTAVNLDGGGSTAMVAAYPGYDTLTAVNQPSDGQLRAGANYIFVVNTAPYLGSIADMKIYGEYTALAGGEVTFDLRAWDENYHCIDMTDRTDVKWSISGDKATIDEKGVLVAGDRSGTVTVTAECEGRTASAEVKIVGSPDEIRLLNKSDGSLLAGSIVLNPSDSLSILAQCIVDGQVMGSTNQSLVWTASGSGVSVDEDGTVTASHIVGRTGTVTVKAGSTTASIRVTVGEVDVALEDFEGSYANVEAGGASIHASIQSTAAYVARGDASGKLTYDFGAAETDSLSLRAGFDLPTTAKYLRVWVYGDGSSNLFTIGGKLADGSAFTLTPTTLDFNGYRQIALRLPDGAAKIDLLTVTMANEQRPTGTIYLDQMVAGRTETELSTRPAISGVTVDTSLTPGSALFKATLSDGGEPLDPASIAATLDGQPIGFMYYASDCQFTTILLAPSDRMLHRLTIQASDPDGNLLRYTYELDGGASVTNSVFADGKGHWSAPVADYLYARGALEGNYTTSEDGSLLLRPRDALTRAEFAVMMAAYLGVDTDRYAAVELPYTDMDAIPQSARGAVAAMYIDKIITGKAASDGSLFFDPQATITRAEIMTIIGRTLPKGHARAELGFTDSDQILEYAYDYVSQLVALGAVGGYEDGSIRPNNPVTRAEGITILYGLY